MIGLPNEASFDDPWSDLGTSMCSERQSLHYNFGTTALSLSHGVNNARLIEVVMQLFALDWINSPHEKYLRVSALSRFMK
jgi:hypothetical protein